MEIVGHGIDVVDVVTFRRWADDPRNPLISRSFALSEIEQAGDGPHRIERLAGRFAAKEAVLKALGTGYGDGVAFTDVIIQRSNDGPPTVHLLGGAATVAVERGVLRWSISISHAGNIAVASAIALGRPHAFEAVAG